MATAPTFGKRGLKGAPALGGRAPAEPPRRRMRSNAVAIGALGLFGLGFTGATAYQEYHCWPPKSGEPDTRPNWCFHSGYGHSSAGHGWGFAGSGSGAGVGHASFGGFGAHGSAHGGGS